MNHLLSNYHTSDDDEAYINNNRWTPDDDKKLKELLKSLKGMYMAQLLVSFKTRIELLNSFIVMQVLQEFGRMLRVLCLENQLFSVAVVGTIN